MTLDQGAAFELIAHHDGWHEGDAIRFAGHESEHGHVIDLGGNDGTDAGLIHEHVEGGADAAFEAGEDDGRFAQVFGEAKRLHAAGFVADEAHGLLIEQMTVPAGLGIAAHGGVGKHNMGGAGLELGQKLTQRAGMDDEFDVVAGDERAQEGELEVSRQIRGCADAEEAAAAFGAVLQQVGEFLAAAEDGVGILECDLAGLGEHEGLVLPLKQRLAEIFLQTAKLDAEGRLRELEVLRGLREAALVGDGAEGTEVVVVQKGHDGMLLAKRTIPGKT